MSDQPVLHPDDLVRHLHRRSSSRPFADVQMRYAGMVYRMMDELVRAEARFPDQHLPWGGKATYKVDADHYRNLCRSRNAAGTVTWLDVVREEAYEAFAEEANDPNGKNRAVAELLQVAAMALRAASDIEASLSPDWKLSSPPEPAGGSG